MKVKIKRADGETVVKLKMTAEEYEALKESIGNLSISGSMANGTPEAQARIVERMYYQMADIST